MSLAEAPADGESRGEVFSPLTAVLMVLVGVFAFSALLVLLTYAPDLESGDDGEAHALSKSAVGFAGIVEALRLAGEPAVVNRAPIGGQDHSGLLIVTPTVDTDRKAIDALSFGGPVLVVAPKWLTLPDARHKGWVGKVRVLEGEAVRGSLAEQLGLRHRNGATRPILRGAPGLIPGDAPLQAGPVDFPQFMTGAGWTPLITDEAGRVILARDPEKPLYVLAEPDLLNTQGIREVANLGAGLAVLRALRAGDGAFVFDVRLNGLGRERSVLRLLFDPPFLAVTLCLAAAAALAGYQAFCRFGPPSRRGRVIPLGKTALVENTAALIRLAGREHRMAGRYAELTADLAARAVGAPRGMGGETLVAFLDRLGAQRRLPEPLSELAIQARMARTAETAAAAAGRLFRWRVAMTGDTEAGAVTPDPPTLRDRP